MYPIALILPIGIIRREGVVALYTLPLALIGAAIAFYHYLLQLKIIPESVAPCVQGLSCSEIQTEYFGFITIPFLSLAAFIIISVVLALTLKNESRK
jgi:disulfide bond formation protein DsbB